jgi:hypothetical protein
MSADRCSRGGLACSAGGLAWRPAECLPRVHGDGGGQAVQRDGMAAGRVVCGGGSGLEKMTSGTAVRLAIGVVRVLA